MTSTDIIDVSSAQAPSSIDWPRVGAAGIIAMYARAGHGLTPDVACKAHLAGGASIYRPRGCYWYWEPEKDPEKQAEMLIEAHVANGCELAPVVDNEDDGSPRKQKVPSSDLGPLLERFLVHVDALLGGKARCALYTMPGHWNQHFAGDIGLAFRSRMLWVANYGVAAPDVPFPFDEFALWQHSANTIWQWSEIDEHGKKVTKQAWGPKKPHPDAVIIAQPGIVDGVRGEVDCNALGNASMQDLMLGTQPVTPLDYSDIAHRQRALRREGFDPGSLDGQWGPRSTKALMQFQALVGLPPNGQWTASVEAAL